jgi:outer membrane protein TolC
MGPADWWTAFGDAELDHLVQRAVSGNHDLAAAQSRVLLARGLTSQAVSPLLPTVAFDVGANATPYSSSSFGMSPQFSQLIEDLEGLQDLLPSDPADPPDAAEPADSDISWSGSALLKFGLRIDPGSSVAALRSARLSAAAAREDRDGVARLLIQQLVTAWLDLRAARLRSGLLGTQEQAHAQLLNVIRARYEAGLTGALDVLRQEQQIAAARSQLPRARQAEQLLQIRMSVMTGSSAPAAPSPLKLGDPTADLPQLPPSPGLGTPYDLLTSRPDLQSAQLRYDAARARQTSDALAFAPSIQLSANVGWSLRHHGAWESQEAYGFGATLQVPLFGGLARVGALQQSAAASRVAANTLSAASQAALAEVESARAVETTEVDRLDALHTLLRAAESAYAQSLQSYEGGLTDYLSVLGTLGVLQQAQLNHLQARRDVLVARVDLHSALGSRWTNSLQPKGAQR